MKVFRDLYLHMQETQTDQFFSELEKILTQGWSREIEKEERSAREFRTKFYYFSCGQAKGLEPALIALTRKNDEIVYVANIVPIEVGELSKDQYNSILMEFYNNLLIPICDRFSIMVEITSDNQNMEDWVTEESYKKLKLFSVAANKSTGSSHPLDKERWFAFIVSIFRKNEKLAPSQLERWLVEEEGWHYDIASDLAIQYEQGLSLLNYNKSH